MTRPVTAPIPNLRELAAALRKLGFRKDWFTRSGGVRCQQWCKRVNDRRRVDVQLWGDGGHRATHSFDGCSDTPPTYFKSVGSMRLAVAREATRMDSKYYGRRK